MTAMGKATAAILLTLAMLLIALTVWHPVRAQGLNYPTIVMHPLMCQPRKEIIKQLKGRSKETAMAAGTMANGTASAEIWVNKETGTFSIVMSVKGRSCMAFAGHNWTDFAPKKIVRGDYM